MNFLKYFNVISSESREIVTSATVTQPEWSDFIPVRESYGSEVAEIEGNMLPESLYQYVRQNAYAINNSNKDYIAISVISSLAALIGGSAIITPKKNDKKWKIKPVIWSLAIGKVSGMKSPTLSIGMKPLEIAQKEVFDSKSIKNICSTNTDKKTRVSNYGNELTSPEDDSYQRDIICNDLTPEALLLKLQSNPLGILIFNDEMSNLFSNFGKQGREQLRPILLEGFNASGNKYVQERKTSGKIVVDTIHINILGGIQPEVLQPLLNFRSEGKGNDGLIERFQLAVYPEPSQSHYVDIHVDESIDERVYSVFKKIAELSFQEKVIYNFTNGAQEKWDRWQKEFQIELNKQTEEYKSSLVKLPALIAKLALIFHIYTEAENSLDRCFSPESHVKEEHFDMALKWLFYLESHHRKILSLRKPIVDPSVKSLIDKLPRLGGSFTKQQLGQKDWKHLTMAKDRNRAIQVLVEHGYLQLVYHPKKMFLIHPELCQKK